MNKVRFLTTVVIILALLNIVSVSLLILGRPAPPPESPKEKIIGILEFDDQQIAEYEKLIVKHQHSMMPLDSEITIIKQEIFSTLADENIQARDSLYNILADKILEMEKLHYNHFLDIRSLCRPEQEENFRRLIPELSSFFSSKPKRKDIPKD